MWLPSGRLARGRAPESARRRAEIGRDPLRVVDGVQVRLTAVGAQEGDHRRRPAVAIEIAADRSIYAPGRPAGHDPVIAKKIMAADGLIPFRHDDELRDDGMVDHWRPDARANPRNEPPKGRASGDHGSFYIDRYHDGVAARFRDPLRDARDRRPGAEADEQVVDAPKHLDEFAAGELVVPARAVRVPVLIRPVGAVDFRHKLGDPGEAAEQEASRAVALSTFSTRSHACRSARSVELLTLGSRTGMNLIPRRAQKNAIESAKLPEEDSTTMECRVISPRRIASRRTQ